MNNLKKAYIIGFAFTVAFLTTFLQFDEGETGLEQFVVMTAFSVGWPLTFGYIAGALVRRMFE